MTYTPLQIEIIKKFGRKDLSFGCVIYYNISPYIFLDERIWYYTVYCCDSVDWIFWYEEIKEKEKVKILWHLPLLEDIFRVAEEKGIYVSISPEITRVYKEFWWDPIEVVFIPHIPLIDQDESTLSQLLSLFK